MALDEMVGDKGHGLLHVSSFGRVEDVEGVAFDDCDKPGGIVGVGGIAAFSQATSPTLIVGHVKVEQPFVSVAPKETGMVGEALLHRAVDTETFVAGVVVAEHRLSFPFFVAFYAEVVVAFAGESAAPGRALQKPLGKGYGGRDAVFILVVDGEGGISLDILLIWVDGISCQGHRRQNQCKYKRFEGFHCCFL